MIKILAAVISIVSATAANAQLPATGPLPETHHSTIGYPTVQAALAALKAKPGVGIQKQQGWIVILDPKDGSNLSEFATWSFAPSGDPAYPAVAKRTFFKGKDGWYVTMNVLCEATKTACDAFVREFQALNERMKNELQHRSQ